MGTSASDVTTSGRRRPSGCRIRLAVVIVLWTVAIEVSLWTVSEKSWGPVVYYLGGTHGVHEGDVLVIAGSLAAATMLSIVLLWPCVRRRRPTGSAARPGLGG